MPQKTRFIAPSPNPALFGFKSYISMPIILPGGTWFGSLCAVDPRPARLNTPEIIGMFKLFAELIAFHVDANRKLSSAQDSLADERKTSELREQFIAVLGHDLRNPLASIDAGTRLLLQTPLNDKALKIAVMMQKSVTRMSGLIDNVLDFARGRLGGGLTLERDASESQEPVLSQVIDELRSRWPERTLHAQFALDGPINCDHSRIGQLFSNLLGNALTHGTADTPILVKARTEFSMFELSVSNSGEPIHPAVMEKLFLPFSRGAVRPGQQGLGLGLHIASEIARAHGGTLAVISSAGETRFTLRMPRD